MNEKIKEAWDAGLKALNPSPRDLEHGLELHRNSVVVESYGFAPRAAVDGDAVKAAIESGASDVEIQDMMEDMPMTRMAFVPAERAEFVEAFDHAGVTCILQNAGEEGFAIPRILKRLARFTYATDMMPDVLLRAVKPDDIVAAKKQGKHCLYMIGNGVPLPQDWNSLEEELRYIRIFCQLGIRMMHLTYQRRNMIGDGCGEPANGGLSDFGRAVVAEMNRQGVIVDVAHTGWRSSLEAAQASKCPMVASHSCITALNMHCRSKPDEVIRAIADTGGYIGIVSLPEFLGRSGDINAMLDHIEYVAKKFGPDHVTIGTDVAYTSRYAEAESKKIPSRAKRRPRWESLWPPKSLDAVPQSREKSLTMAWTNWPLFTVGLVQRGHSDDAIQKIIGGNVLRVARAVWDSREEAKRMGNG